MFSGDRPLRGETRTVNIELNNGRLGIDIDTSQTSGGIFVAWVDPQSVAASCGIMVGDQILEVSKDHCVMVRDQILEVINDRCIILRCVICCMHC